jgi:hypothetical protein
MTALQLRIEHRYTADVVHAEYDANGIEVGWRCVPEPPEGTEHWEIFDFSPDSKTGWRRVGLEGAAP